jgi:predicted  nucleic acid-binding Zn-ribbon protein
MEWAKEAVIAACFAVMGALHMYDKAARDKRFSDLEGRMKVAEKQANKQQTQLEVMNVELKAFSDLTDVRLGHIQTTVDKVLHWLEKQAPSNIQ